MDTLTSENSTPQAIMNGTGDADQLVWDAPQPSPAEQPVEKPLSERDFKIAYAKAVKERKEAIKRNKEMIADLELEVSYWKAQSDLLKYRFEKMDYYLKNLELEPRYQKAVEEQKAKELENMPPTTGESGTSGLQG